jgi:hypothetical protein
MLALWEAFKDRLDPDRVSARQAALEQRERERNERDKLDRANRARELEDWRAQQHLNLRRNLIERRQAFEAQRFEELERLETEARRQRELTQRAQRDRERSGPDRDRDDR